MEKPKEPRPEDFGLTQDRVRELEYRFDDLPGHVGLAVWLICLAIVVWFFYSTSKSIGATFFLLILFGFGFSIIPAFIVASMVGAIASPHQPPEFKSYKKARAEYERQLSEWFRTQESWWRSLDGGSFEAELMRLLQKRGYDVHRTGAFGDGGVDLILKEGGRTIAIQCKAHKNPVGPGPVRDLYGTLMHRKDTEAWLISTSGFSGGAEAFASGKPIRLLTIGAILRGRLCWPCLRREQRRSQRWKPSHDGWTGWSGRNAKDGRVAESDPYVLNAQLLWKRWISRTLVAASGPIR